MVSMRHSGGRYGEPYEVLKHAGCSVNGRLGAIQSGAWDKRGSDKFDSATQTVREIPTLSQEGGPSVGEEVVKVILKSPHSIVFP